MGYYMGDFYGQHRLGTLRGDPGFFGFLGKIARGIGQVAGIIGPKAARPTEAIVARMPGGAVLSRAGEIAGAVARSTGHMIAKHPVLSAAGAAGAAVGIGAAGERMLAGPGQRRGFHVNKHGKVVRNRHMNVCNPRALRRSIRRAHGFARLAMKTIHLVHPKKKVRFGGFRKARKRAA